MALGTVILAAQTAAGPSTLQITVVAGTPQTVAVFASTAAPLLDGETVTVQRQVQAAWYQAYDQHGVPIVLTPLRNEATLLYPGVYQAVKSLTVDLVGVVTDS